MIKFNLFRRENYAGPHRLSYHTARKQRQDFWRRARMVSVAVLGLVTAVVILNLQPQQPTPVTSNQPETPGQAVGQQGEPNPLADKKLYADPISNAANQATEWRFTQPAKAIQMDKLADQPSSRWFSNAITFDDVHGYVAAAQDQGALPVTVAYFMPKRDCTKYSSGGAATEALYYDYIDTYAKAIGNMDAVVILEPDALVHTVSATPQGQPCLNDAERQMYFSLLSYAVDRFKSLPATLVYIDAGNSGWKNDTDQIADLLKKANIEKADGFALNVSNFQKTDDTVVMGAAISAKTSGKHYVIDTSRNGLGPFQNTINPDYSWCNPPGRALGHYPTVNTNIPRVDAFLYIKNIGESDGTDPDKNKCFGGPSAGTWWPDYAAGLVERWPANLQFNYKP